MHRSALLMLTIATLAVATGARAQQCTSDDTALTCWTRFNPDVAAEAAKKVATTNTGTPTAASDATAAALRDFLSVFAAGVETGKVSENGTVVTLDWNVPLPFIEGSDRVKLQTLFTDSDLAKDVQTALGGNATTAKSKLTNFDDITALAAYSPVNARMGRSLEPHRKLLDALNSDIEQPAEEAQKFAQMLADNLPAHPELGTFVESTPFNKVTDPVLRAKMIAQMQNIAMASQKAGNRGNKIIKALTLLINNQPQPFASVIYHNRNALVGQDEFSVKGTFELSPKSLNRFLDANKDVCGATINATDCGDRLIAFAAADDPSKQPDASDRLSFSIEYKQAKHESVALSLYSVTDPLVRTGTHSVVYSLTYGHPLSGATLRDARYDVAVNYDNVSNDATKKDRFVATVTLSQKLSEKMTLPLTLTYANHTNYLPQTDRRLGIHFGISYKIPNMSGQ